MDQNEIIGAKLKAYRQERHLTLKQLSEQVELSVGFLSQVERGRAALSLNTLSKLAAVLEIEVAAFFGEMAREEQAGLVVRSYERRFLRTSNRFIQYSLCPDVHHTEIFPEIYEIYPGETSEFEEFQHEQEEFDYVLEGVLSVIVDGSEYTLYPGDGIRVPPNAKHVWRNDTTKMVRLFSVALRARPKK